jgi:hypothetical protein
MQSVLTSTAFLLLGGGVSQCKHDYTFDTAVDPSVRSTKQSDDMHTIIPIMDANLSQANVRESVMNAYRQAEPVTVDPLHRKIAGQIAEVFVAFRFGYRPTLDLIDDLTFVLARDHPKSRYELMLYPDIAYDRPLLKALVAYGNYLDNGNMTGITMLV